LQIANLKFSICNLQFAITFFAISTTEHYMFNTTNFFGVGVRASGKGEEIRPYFQTSVYFVSEDVESDGPAGKITGTATSVGIGFSGGIDIKASKLISIPIEVTYIASNDEGDIDNLSGFGISAGINFNF